MTAPTSGNPGPDSNARGIAVLVVAVAIGILLLLNADDGTSEAVSSGGPTTTIDVSNLSTTEPGSDTTTTTDDPGGSREASEVEVIVLNGSGQAGVAGTNSKTIGAKGYTMLDPGNALTNTAETSVYYAEGFQADALAIATALGQTADSVKAKPSSPLGNGSVDADADVVVVIGSDTATATSASSTTSTTSAN